MPNIKWLSALWIETGKTMYTIIRREADGYLLNDADGAFVNAPADPYLTLPEHATIKGLYEVAESRAAWNDGRYTFVVYKQTGGAPAPASDTIIGGGELYIVADAEVVLDASVASRSTLSSGAAMTLTAAYDAAKTAAQETTLVAGITALLDAIAGIAAAVWGAAMRKLTSAWTDEAVARDMAATGEIEGQYIVTVTFKDQGGNFIPGVHCGVRAANGADNTEVHGDDSGIASFSRNPDDYLLLPKLAGYTFPATVPFTVIDADLPVAVVGTRLTTPLSGDPDGCMLVADLISFGLAPRAGVKLSATLQHAPQATAAGQIVDPGPWEAFTLDNGRASLPLPQGFKWYVEFAPLGRKIAIDTTGKAEVILADVVKALYAGGS